MTADGEVSLSTVPNKLWAAASSDEAKVGT